MVGFWVSFALIFLIVPGVVAFAKISLKDYVKIEITPEMNKAANVRLAKYVFLYWLCDLFYMACFINNIICKFVFGGLILFIVFMNLAGVFTLPKEKTGFEKWGILQDFIIGIGLTIYLIYIIPNKELQSIVVPIVAAVYGGLLTLTGVSWTIKHNVNEKRKDELAKAVPLFTFVLFAEVEPQAYSRKTCIVEGNGKARSFVELENSNRAAFYIKRVYFDESWHNVNANNMLLPNDKLLIEMRRNDIVEHPIMEIEDLYGRKYYYDLMFCMMPGIIQAAMFPTRFTLCELKGIPEEETKKRIENLNKFELNNSGDKKEA